MTKTLYVGIQDINESQTKILRFVNVWVHEKKTPIPLKEIIEDMKKQGIERPTVVYSIKILLQKGYMRRAVTISNKSSYVQLKTI